MELHALTLAARSYVLLLTYQLGVSDDIQSGRRSLTSDLALLQLSRLFPSFCCILYKIEADKS